MFIYRLAESRSDRLIARIKISGPFITLYVPNERLDYTEEMIEKIHAKGYKLLSIGEGIMHDYAHGKPNKHLSSYINQNKSVHFHVMCMQGLATSHDLNTILDCINEDALSSAEKNTILQAYAEFIQKNGLTQLIEVLDGYAYFLSAILFGDPYLKDRMPIFFVSFKQFLMYLSGENLLLDDKKLLDKMDGDAFMMIDEIKVNHKKFASWMTTLIKHIDALKQLKGVLKQLQVEIENANKLGMTDTSFLAVSYKYSIVKIVQLINKLPFINNAVIPLAIFEEIIANLPYPSFNILYAKLSQELSSLFNSSIKFDGSGFEPSTLQMENTTLQADSKIYQKSSLKHTIKLLENYSSLFGAVTDENSYIKDRMPIFIESFKIFLEVLEANRLTLDSENLLDSFPDDSSIRIRQIKLRLKNFIIWLPSLLKHLEALTELKNILMVLQVEMEIVNQLDLTNANFLFVVYKTEIIKAIQKINDLPRINNSLIPFAIYKDLAANLPYANFNILYSKLGTELSQLFATSISFDETELKRSIVQDIQRDIFMTNWEINPNWFLKILQGHSVYLCDVLTKQPNKETQQFVPGPIKKILDHIASIVEQTKDNGNLAISDSVLADLTVLITDISKPQGGNKSFEQIKEKCHAWLKFINETCPVNEKYNTSTLTIH